MNNELGQILKSARIAKNWKVADILKEIKRLTGRVFGPAYISQIERARKAPAAEMVIVLAVVLDLDPDDLWAKAMRLRRAEFEQRHADQYEGAKAEHETLTEQQKGTETHDANH